jgi:cell division protein ZapA
MSTRVPAAERPLTLDVNILGRDYKVACKESERAELTEAVTYLDNRMREIRDGGKITGADRIAVMAALNITHELLRGQRAADKPAAPASAPAAVPATAQRDIDAAPAQRRIRDMHAAIDQLMAGQDKLF